MLNTEVGAPVPPAPDLATAQAATFAMASILVRIEREAPDKLRICRSIDDIRHCIETGVLAAVLHIEGAEAIDEKFEALDVFYQRDCARSARCGADPTFSATACRSAARRRPTPGRA